MRGSVTMIVLVEAREETALYHSPLHLEDNQGYKLSSVNTYLIKSGTGVEVM